jgi:hypothetical protein
MSGSESSLASGSASRMQANDIIAMNGLPDRHGGCPLACFGRGFTEADERLMNGRDQRPELVGPDLVSPNISCDDVGREFSIK